MLPKRTTALIACALCVGLSPVSSGEIHTVPPGDGVEQRLHDLLVLAAPGDTIQLEAGTYSFGRTLHVTGDNVTIRGRGPGRTILSFRGQRSGGTGIEASGDALVIAGLAVEDTRSNAIRVTGADGVTLRRVRVEWTGGSKTSNGGYGLYPVLCRNVLIEDCVAIGASDAGVYVGQSRQVIVRGCRAEKNVAGIEIENSIRVDVTGNTATGNAGGILVFDLPGLTVKNGRDVRVFDNRIVANNHANFAPAGSMVAKVAPGTGLMVLAASGVEVFDNTILDNDSFNVSVYSYQATGNRIDDPDFHPFAERVFVHDNEIRGGGNRPRGEAIEPVRAALGTPFPQIVHDGIRNPGSKAPGLVLRKNGDADFANLRLPELFAGRARIDRDIAKVTGSLPRLPAVGLEPHPRPEAADRDALAAYRRAPATLASFGLFRGSGASQEPVEGVVPYDLNTPLFSDYTRKYRFVRLPANEKARYREDAVFDFPVGTVIAKTFSMPRDLRDPGAGERLLETRILTHEPSGWHGFSYAWNDEQTEARLRLGGDRLAVSWLHGDGKRRESEYELPSASECRSCHEVDGVKRLSLPIGPRARNLNRDFAYAHGTGNQLEEWTARGMLSGAPAPGKAPRVARAADPNSGTVDARARAWLDINCAHCHSAVGPARASGLDLTLEQTDLSRLGVMKPPVAAGPGSGGRRFGIVPGDPDASILVYRIQTARPGRAMPPLSRRVVHEEGLALIREWIAAMPKPRQGAGSEK